MSVVRGLYLTVLITTALFRLAVVIDNTLRIWREKKRDTTIAEQDSDGNVLPPDAGSFGPKRDSKGRFRRSEQHGRKRLAPVRDDARSD